MLRGFRDREVAESVHSKSKELPSTTKIEWAHTTKQIEPQGLQIHIYNFLLTEGHFDIAQTFASQAGLPSKLTKVYQSNPSTNPTVTGKRLQIKNLIKANKIDEAITQIGAYQPLQKDEKWHQEIIFSLLCLKVVNMIKEQNLQEAIETARNDLLPLTSKHHERVTVLEKVMSLVAFVDVKECQNHDLAGNQHKNALAEEVNSYLLGKNSRESLKQIVAVGKWLQKRLDVHLNFPHLNLWAPDMYQQ